MIQRMKKTEKQKNRERKTAEKRRAKLIWHRILELLYPTTCVFCGTVASEGICESCRKEVKILQEPLCKKCGKPVRYEEQEYCYDCQKIIHFYEQGRSLWLHKMPVSQSIYQFKYRNRRVFAQYYAEQMAEQFADLLRKWQIEVIILYQFIKVSGENEDTIRQKFWQKSFPGGWRSLWRHLQSEEFKKQMH